MQDVLDAMFEKKVILNIVVIFTTLSIQAFLSGKRDLLWSSKTELQFCSKRLRKLIKSKFLKRL